MSQDQISWRIIASAFAILLLAMISWTGNQFSNRLTALEERFTTMEKDVVELKVMVSGKHYSSTNDISLKDMLSAMQAKLDNNYDKPKLGTLK